MHPHTLIMTARIALAVHFQVGGARVPAIVETTLREMWHHEHLYLQYKNGPKTLFRTLQSILCALVTDAGEVLSEYDRLVEEKELLELDSSSLQKIILTITQQSTEKGA